MAELKMPEINYVIVAGNLTKDPIFRETTNKTPVVNFSLARKGLTEMVSFGNIIVTSHYASGGCNENHFYSRN